MRTTRHFLFLLSLPSILTAQDFRSPDLESPAGEPESLLQQSSVSLSDSTSSGVQASTYFILREQEASAEAAEQLSARTQEQGAAFSKEFTRLNPFAEDFPEAFAALLTKYPLASGDEFAAKLIDRGNRMLKATKRDAALPQTTPASAREALEADIQAYKKNYSGSDIETDEAYIELRRRLNELSPTP